ncbi:MAG: cytochrome c [Myxococcales bacterium]|nr:cytochrome c [Myxococcales bacterium]
MPVLRSLRLGLLLLVVAPSALWAGQPTKHPAPEERGAKLYAEACAVCHGADALGDGPLAQATRKPAPRLAGQVRAEPAAVEVLARGRGEMPGFGERYDDSDLLRILTFLQKVDPTTGKLPKKAGATPTKPAKAPPSKAQSPEEAGPGAPEGAGGAEAGDEAPQG